MEKAIIERAANGYAVVIEHKDENGESVNHLSVHGSVEDAQNFVSEFFQDVEKNEAEAKSNAESEAGQLLVEDDHDIEVE